MIRTKEISNPPKCVEPEAASDRLGRRQLSVSWVCHDLHRKKHLNAFHCFTRVSTLISNLKSSSPKKRAAWIKSSGQSWFSAKRPYCFHTSKIAGNRCHLKSRGPHLVTGDPPGVLSDARPLLRHPSTLSEGCPSGPPPEEALLRPGLVLRLLLCVCHQAPSNCQLLYQKCPATLQHCSLLLSPPRGRMPDAGCRQLQSTALVRWLWGVASATSALLALLPLV